MVVIWGILVVVLSVLLVLAGLVLVQRMVPLKARESANTVTGPIYAALYAIFGITLAFSLYLARQEVDEVEQTTERRRCQPGEPLPACRPASAAQTRRGPRADRVLLACRGRGRVAIAGEE